MPRRKRSAPRRLPDPSPTPFQDPPLTLPPAPEVETLADLVERAARIKRTSDALIRQMKELEGQIIEATTRNQNRRR